MRRFFLLPIVIVATILVFGSFLKRSSKETIKEPTISKMHIFQNSPRFLMAVGLRNPWRSSFDQLSGNFWTGGTELYFWKKTIYVRSSNLA